MFPCRLRTIASKHTCELPFSASFPIRRFLRLVAPQYRYNAACILPWSPCVDRRYKTQRYRVVPFRFECWASYSYVGDILWVIASTGYEWMILSWLEQSFMFSRDDADGL